MARAAAASRHKKPVKNWQLQYGLAIGGMAASIVLAIVAMMFNPDRGASKTPVNDRNLILHVNRNAKSWRAGSSSFFEGWTMGDMKSLSGIGVSNGAGGISECVVQELEKLPASFDSREKWPQCFGPVYTMGNCSSSWAIASASAVANRLCIANPLENAGMRLSPQSLLSCDKANMGCNGGNLDKVWTFMKTEGLVSEECFTYQANSEMLCDSRCDTEEPKRIGSVCKLGSASAIRREILLNGPVVAPLILTNDLLVYRSGIYEVMRTASQLFTADQQRQLHAVKFIGWGSQDHKSYWIIENSFGPDWGENGFAKIASGEQSIFLEEFVFAGTPSSSKLGLPEDVKT
eukprot:TRINITY_DN50825_c0_g1_i1.p1 TRINITY_DN50825_c0_g1~~TRINITY_DN50825_c0_g1_i1.p1  ORF type:complete len:365 (-),score=70.12 TRINITY_DN50825_c0_g1_i1:363-1403(-)